MHENIVVSSPKITVSTAYIVRLCIYKVLKHIKLCIIMYQSLNFNIRLVAYIATSYNKNLNKDNQ